MIDIDLNKRRWVVVFIFIAFLLGVISRLYWINWASDFDEMIHNGTLMINTNDGYALPRGRVISSLGFINQMI